MATRDEQEIDRILERIKAKLIKLEERKANNVSRMHRLREENEKIDMSIEKLTGSPVEKPKVEINNEKS